MPVGRRARALEEEVASVFRRWGLEVTQVGEVTDSGRAKIMAQGRTFADMPIEPLTENAPVLRRPVAVPADLAARQADPEVPVLEDLTGTLLRLLDTPEMGSKAWIWGQYDHTVRTNTVVGPGGDAAVLKLKGTPSGLALTSDVNPVYCYLDPRTGGAQAVAEAVRNLACTGAEPVGLTDCLNFGSPENPEIAWQFRECVRGMSDACRALAVPVISGNVSFYNETSGRAVHPTPTVAMVGVIPELDARLPRSHFVGVGDRIVLLGDDRSEFGGSAYLRLLFEIEQGRPPAVDLEAEHRLALLLRGLIARGQVRTAHDVSDGGLAVALAEACIGGRLGANVAVAGAPTQLFSESQARAVVACQPKQLPQVLASAASAGVSAVEIGGVGGDRLRVHADGASIDVSVETIHQAWSTALPRALGF